MSQKAAYLAVLNITDYLGFHPIAHALRYTAAPGDRTAMKLAKGRSNFISIRRCAALNPAPSKRFGR
jgi:hypothetical protein